MQIIHMTPSYPSNFSFLSFQLISKTIDNNNLLISILEFLCYKEVFYHPVFFQQDKTYLMQLDLNFLHHYSTTIENNVRFLRIKQTIYKKINIISVIKNNSNNSNLNSFWMPSNKFGIQLNFHYSMSLVNSRVL